MSQSPAWKPGEMEAALARLQQLEERVTGLAGHWEAEGVPASDYAAQLRGVMEDPPSWEPAGRCPWKIHWSVAHGQCVKNEHLPADPEHQVRVGVTDITWLAGDRREFTGDCPGDCLRVRGCLLPAGHHGRCAP